MQDTQGEGKEETDKEKTDVVDLAAYASCFR